jgi:hypothetical protein
MYPHEESIFLHPACEKVRESGAYKGEDFVSDTIREKDLTGILDELIEDAVVSLKLTMPQNHLLKRNIQRTNHYLSLSSIGSQGGNCQCSLPHGSNSHYEIFYNISNSCEFLSVVDNFVFRRISLKFSFF